MVLDTEKAWIDHLRQLPPTHYHWPELLAHTLKGLAAQSPFLSPEDTPSEALKEVLQRFSAYGVQDLLVSEHLCVAWVRELCEALRIQLGTESPATQTQQLYYTSLQQHHAHQELWQKDRKRQQALQDMRQRNTEKHEP